jgi:hypothetical protein
VHEGEVACWAALLLRVKASGTGGNYRSGLGHPVSQSLAIVTQASPSTHLSPGRGRCHAPRPCRHPGWVSRCWQCCPDNSSSSHGMIGQPAFSPHLCTCTWQPVLSDTAAGPYARESLGISHIGFQQAATGCCWSGVSLPGLWPPVSGVYTGCGVSPVEETGVVPHLHVLHPDGTLGVPCEAKRVGRVGRASHNRLACTQQRLGLRCSMYCGS